MKRFKFKTEIPLTLKNNFVSNFDFSMNSSLGNKSLSDNKDLIIN
jgi:hypothetical protein